MSTGAKAGIALGVLLGIGALLIGILLVYRRKKKQMAVNPDKEKTEMSNTYAPPPEVHVAPASTPSVRTMSTAPRLSVRPVTQFDPVFEQRKSAANLLNVAAAPLAKSQDRDLPARPSNSWERPGAAHAPTNNPFTDPKAASANHSETRLRSTLPRPTFPTRLLTLPRCTRPSRAPTLPTLLLLLPPRPLPLLLQP
jgi:LPXTG-motif cell wall-anchored protein